MRWLLLLFALLTATAQAREWAFDVYLGHDLIGRHTFQLEEHGTTRTLVSDAHFRVKLLFINAYSYDHTAHETWQGNCLTALDAHTDENRQISAVSGHLQGEVFTLTGPKGTFKLPQCVMTYAYWNPAMLTQQKLINPQTGEWQAVTIRPVGMETIQVRDKPVQAEHYHLAGKKLNIDLWYSLGHDWLALQSTTPEGHVIRYQLR